MRSHRAGARRCQPRNLLVRLAEALCVKASLKLNVRILVWHACASDVPDFIFKADQIVLHCVGIFVLDVDPRSSPCVSLRGRDPGAAICCQVLPLFVVGLLVGDLLQVHLRWLKDSFSPLAMRSLRCRRHWEHRTDRVNRYVAETAGVANVESPVCFLVNLLANGRETLSFGLLLRDAHVLVGLLAHKVERC